MPELKSDLAEPLRVLQAELGILTGSAQSKEALDGLRTAAGRDKVQVLKFAMYTHPGRRLPLGWALSPGILDDIDQLYQLAFNQTAASDFARMTAQPAP